MRFGGFSAWAPDFPGFSLTRFCPFLSPPYPAHSSHHFQSADALSVVQLPASAGGGLLAATFDAEGVAAYLLPGTGDVQTLGSSSQVGRHWAAH